MKRINFWTAALMALSFSTAFIACSDSNDNDDTTDKAEQAKAIAGTYKGYSIGESRMFSDYLMGTDATAVVTANNDGTIDLEYRSGSGDFVLKGLKVNNRAFEGEGQVALGMGGGSASNYDYTLEGNVDNQQVLSLKVNIPAPMGGLNIEFIQGETPVSYLVADTYQYDSELSLSVMGNVIGTTDEAKVIVRRVSDNTVDVELNGLSHLSGGGSMNLADFTIANVNVTADENGGYTLNLGTFEAMSGTTVINGNSLEGTIDANGTAALTVSFQPGAMPMAIIATFHGSNIRQ